MYFPVPYFSLPHSRDPPGGAIHPLPRSGLPHFGHLFPSFWTPVPLILDTCSPHFGHRYCTAFLWVLWVLWGLWVSWTSPQSVVSVASVAIPLFGHLFTFPHSRETPVLHSVFITFLACLSRICGTRKRGKTFHSRAAGFIYSFQITFRCSAPRELPKPAVRDGRRGNKTFWTARIRVCP